MAICWECETETAHPVEKPLPGLSRPGRLLLLCQACYQRHYLPLMVELGSQSTRAEALPAAARRSDG